MDDSLRPGIKLFLLPNKRPAENMYLCGFTWLQIDIEQFLEGLDPIPTVVDNADDVTDSSDFDTEESSTESESEVCFIML